MKFLAAGGNPLGHVLDVPLIGGDKPALGLMEGQTILGSPILTMHMVTLVFVTLLLIVVMNKAAKAITTGAESQGNERYITKGRLSQFIEVITLYMRDTVFKPLLGEQTNKYLPFLLTLFFFVLANNLFGLIPLLDIHALGGRLFGQDHFAFLGGTATANLAVTGVLALFAFFVIQAHGIRELGVGGWLHHLLGGAPWWLFPIMVPVELMGMFIKPGALAVRLFANMLAGHTLMAVIAGFGAMALGAAGDNWAMAGGVSVVSIAFSVAITFLELFVAFLQAFIFMFLTTIFIGQLSHHDDHGHEGEHAHA